MQQFRLSSRTIGARFAGSRPIGKTVRLSYTASFARQADIHRNPENYAADYYLLDGKLDVGSLSLGGGYEVLGADNGRLLTSFQTPSATLHKFQGWTDKFLTTPPNGVRDLYTSAGCGWKRLAGLDAINAGVTWHRFRSDRLDIHYGREWDAVLSAKRGRLTATAKLADYAARAFATDTRKAWLELDWAYHPKVALERASFAPIRRPAGCSGAQAPRRCGAQSDNIRSFRPIRGLPRLGRRAARSDR